MANTKKSEQEATEKVVDVAVPAVKGVALNDIYKAALTSVRDEVPLVSNLSYEVVDAGKVNNGERTYKVKISWADQPQPTDPRDEPQGVDGHLEALAVPTSLPVESNPTA